MLHYYLAVPVAAVLAWVGPSGITAPLPANGDAPTKAVADTTCRSADDPWVLMISGSAKWTISQPSRARSRVRYGLQQGDSASVILETDDAKCARAARLIAEHTEIPLSELRPVVLRIGPKYWIVDPKVGGGGDVWTFIANNNLSQILYRPRAGR
jgi:hypothetical protein